MTAAGKTRARKTSLSISHHPTDNDDDDQNDDDGNDGGDDEKICERSADLPRLATTSRTPTLDWRPHTLTLTILMIVIVDMLMMIYLGKFAVWRMSNPALA